VNSALQPKADGSRDEVAVLQRRTLIIKLAAFDRPRLSMIRRRHRCAAALAAPAIFVTSFEGARAAPRPPPERFFRNQRIIDQLRRWIHLPDPSRAGQDEFTSIDRAVPAAAVCGRWTILDWNRAEAEALLRRAYVNELAVPDSSHKVLAADGLGLAKH
jgi:hypothetical protein